MGSIMPDVEPTHPPVPSDDPARTPLLAPVARGPIAAAASFLLILLVRGYQVALRPLLIGSCKYCPTCSEYFVGAVQKHGPIRGTALGLWRFLRCHPFARGGYDPVP
jgi:putative membrane protein insertion efficiency factor